MLGVLVTGMLVPYNDDRLLQDTGTAAESPYVIVMVSAGIKVLPSIINAAILTSAFSAGNSFLFASSRVLYGLALRGQAPRILTYCTKSGLPIAAVLLTSCFSLLAFMNVSKGAATVFKNFGHVPGGGGSSFSWGDYGVLYSPIDRGECMVSLPACSVHPQPCFPGR